MKDFKTILKKEGGFTLVELMIVVAIIGILSAVAIPNFKKYQAKSKVSEGKILLSSLYTAQQTFYSDYSQYAACLAQMGFDPAGGTAANATGVGTGTGRNPGYYAVGFAEANSNGANAAARAANQWTTASDPCQDNNRHLFAASKGLGANTADEAAFTGAFSVLTAGNTLPAIPAVTSTTPIGITGPTDSYSVFRAGALGFIDSSGVTALTASRIVIDHQKLIREVSLGY